MLGLTEKAGDVMRTVDKLEKIGAEKVSDHSGRRFRRGSCYGGRDPRSSSPSPGTQRRGASRRWRATAARTRCSTSALEELNTVANLSAARSACRQDHFAVDLTIARGLDYYTGTVYETAMLDHPEIGSICSGGRYDNLAEYYTDKQLPGVGISIGLTRLFYVLGEQGYLNDQMNTAPADVLILPMTDDHGRRHQDSLPLCVSAGIRTQLYSEQKKFKAQDRLRRQAGHSVRYLPRRG